MHELKHSDGSKVRLFIRKKIFFPITNAVIFTKKRREVIKSHLYPLSFLVQLEICGSPNETDTIVFN